MTLIHNNPEINKKIEELLSSDYGTITSTLTRRFGPEYLIQIDNIVSDSFKEAKTEWTTGSFPADPKNRIWQFVTDNSSDLFCVKIHNRQKIQGIQERNTPINFNYPDSYEAVENNTVMLFTCCHPTMEQGTRMSLVLKILGGYTLSSIAKVLSGNELAVADEINNAKLGILSSKIPFEIPEKYILSERLDYILDTLHSIFEIGYNHPNDKIKIYPELSNTAVNLLENLASHPQTNLPKTRALLSYMYLCSSRLQSMKDKNGNLLSLKEQDRSLWNRDMINKGIDYLYSSASGREVTVFHLKAGVAAVHSTSAAYESTNWEQIISLYNNYLEFNQCPLSELEKAVAVSKLHGPQEGLKLIEMIEDREKISENVLLPMTVGNMYLQLHKYDDALSNFSKAQKLTENSLEKNYINNKIHICEQRIKMTARYKHGLSF